LKWQRVMFQKINNIPEKFLPKDIKPDDKICLKMSGGLGDALIVAACSNIGGDVTIACRSHQMSTVSMLGVKVMSVYDLNNLANLAKFNYVIDFNFCFANQLNLVDKDYYSCAWERLGRQTDIKEIPVEEGKLKSNTIAIHAGSSNPNRRWSNDSWSKVGQYYLDQDFDIVWLGTRHEFGWTGSKSIKLSDISEDLGYQSKFLTNCSRFVGNDSGFAHVAGLAGVEGSVVFFNTWPHNVIRHYKSLHGVDVYDKVGPPTMELREAEGGNSYKCIDALTPQIFLGLEPDFELKSPNYDFNKPIISVVGDSRATKFFKDNLTVDFNVSDESVNYEIDPDNKLLLISGEAYPFIGGPHDVLRTIREIENA